MSPIGILPINKPCGVRSTECVEKIRRILGRKVKVGHGGTLDSTASGLLTLLIGPATRLSSFMMSLPKHYETVLQLGTTTSTDDASGDVLTRSSFADISETQVDAALISFSGWRLQTPPVISAVHVDGKRAHELARGGEIPILQAKPVFLKRIERRGNLSPEGRLAVRVDCSKGTYIRSFARDLGQRLGCGAHVFSLERSQSGPFSADEARGYDELLEMTTNELLQEIKPLDTLYGCANTYRVPAARLNALRNGMSQDLKRLERHSLGSCRSDAFVIIGDGVFSVCEARREGGTIALLPGTNLFFGEKAGS